MSTRSKKKPRQAFSAAEITSSEDLFTIPREAQKELARRRKDAALVKKVHADFHPSIQPILAHFKEGPRALLFRQIATPAHEILRFIRMAKHVKLEPLILEYYEDKFVGAGNSYKRALGKLPVYQHVGADGRDNVRYVTIVDFNAYVGKSLSEVMCKTGEPLIQFHHQLFKKILSFDEDRECVDATTWFKALGGRAASYYDDFLSLFICDAILFEYFEPTPEEHAFSEQVMIPAFKRVTEKYGVHPLIVRLVPRNKESRRYWTAYPAKTMIYL